MGDVFKPRKTMKLSASPAFLKRSLAGVILSLLLIVFGTSAQGEKLPTATVHPALFLIGDSTMANKSISPPNPERGWGQIFPTLFKEPARVVNLGVNGRSTKNYRVDGLWDKAVAQIQPGDFVLLQFCHNDQKTGDEIRYTDVKTEFPDNLKRFIAEAREKGASVLIATPVNRRRYSNAGRFVDSHGPYPDAIRAVAKEENVPLIDVHKITFDILKKQTQEETKKLFIYVKPGEYTRYPEGIEDDNHLSKEGALWVSQLIADELRAQKHPLAEWLK